jgi:hypothetical protein
VKCFQQEFLNNPVCAPTVTFFDYLDSWRIQHLKQLATSDKPTVPSSSSADCIGLSNLSTYYLDTLYEYASKLSLYEVFMDKKDWIEDAHILSRALDTVESIGHNIARRNGMIVTDEDSRELLEVLLRLFDEQTAILIRARILSEYRRRNNIKDGQDRSGIIKATTVQESEARRVVIKPRRKLTSRKVVIPKAEHNSMTTNDESKAVPGMARFISPAQDSPGVEIARRPSDFRPRLYSRYRTSSFTLKTAPEVVKANAESWVHRLSAVPDETSEYANSALPSAALLRFDPAHDDEDAVLRHYARFTSP